MKSIFITTSFILLFSQTFSQNTQISSFSESKEYLLEIYKKRPVTLYCGCTFKGKEPNFLSCGYIPKKNNKRANRVEWEHVVPAHAFGNSFKEWESGHPDCVNKYGKKFKGRRCAEKMNEEFRRMQADMYNLYPVIGEVNEKRSNFGMAIIEGETREFGECDIEIKDRIVEPKEDIRGEIARTYMYMDLAYPGRGIISEKNRDLFESWDKSDPVDQWECERAKMIEQMQGNENKMVKVKC